MKRRARFGAVFRVWAVRLMEAAAAVIVIREQPFSPIPGIDPMNTDDLTVSEDTKAAIRGFLEHELTSMGVKDVIIEGMLDHDDEPSLRIVVEYNDQGPAMDTRRLARLVTPLRTLLLQRGEKRFPFIRHNVTDRRPLMSYVKR